MEFLGNRDRGLWDLRQAGWQGEGGRGRASIPASIRVQALQASGLKKRKPRGLGLWDLKQAYVRGGRMKLPSYASFGLASGTQSRDKKVGFGRSTYGT